MRPNQLNPAQLMMGFLSSEHGKLSQKIVASEFSRELDAQSSQLATVSCFGPSLPEGGFAKDANPSHGSVAQTTLSRIPDIDKPLNGHGQKARALQRFSPRSRSAEASQEKVREDLVFTDIAMVESIAAQLRLPAEARKALKSSEDNQGRISFKTLAAILNQQIPSDREVLPGQDQATAQDVQQLLNSIRQAHPDPAQRLPRFKAKPAGAYSIEEFKNTLEDMVQQIAREKMRAKQTLAGLRSGGHSSSSDSHDLPASPTSVSPGQVQLISSNLMPSFSDTNFLNEDEGKQRSVFAAPPAEEDSYRPQTPQETMGEASVPTDTRVLDRILAQLPDPEQARQLVRSAEDTRGRISYRALAAILNEQTVPGPDMLTGQVRIAVRDVQELFGSIPQSEPAGVNQPQPPQIETANDEFCTLEELKTALGKIDHRIVRQRTNTEKADMVPVQTVRGREDSAPDAISLVIKQEDSALEPVQAIGRESDVTPEAVQTISRKADFAPEPVQFSSRQQDSIDDSSLIYSKQLGSFSEPMQSRAKLGVFVGDPSGDKKPHSAPEQVQPSAKQEVFVGAPSADKQPRFASEPVLFSSGQQDSIDDSSLIYSKQLSSFSEPVQSRAKQEVFVSEPSADKKPLSAPESVQPPAKQDGSSSASSADKQPHSAPEPVQSRVKLEGSFGAPIAEKQPRLAPEPMHFSSRQQDSLNDSSLVYSKQLSSVSEPVQSPRKQEVFVSEPSADKQPHFAAEPVQSPAKQEGSFSAPIADNRQRSAPEPVQFVGRQKRTVAERRTMIQEQQESPAPTPAFQSTPVTRSVSSEKISPKDVENTHFPNETVELKGVTPQGDNETGIRGRLVEAMPQPEGPIHSGSERMAQLGNLDSSLVFGAEEEAHSAQLKEESSLEELSGTSPNESGSRQETSKTAPFQSSTDASSQDGREAKQGREFAGFQAEEKAPQTIPSKPDSFPEISSSMQINQAGQQGSRASSSPVLSLSNPNWPVELSERFHELKEQRRNELTLELEPQNMGKLTLRIETENNHVTAWISTDNDHVKSLLTQNSPVLRQHLQEQGLMLGQFLVDVRQEKGNQHYPQQNRTARRHSRNVSAIAETEADETKAGLGRKIYGQGSGEQLISFFA